VLDQWPTGLMAEGLARIVACVNSTMLQQSVPWYSGYVAMEMVSSRT
jgi:hypothetical protein